MHQYPLVDLQCTISFGVINNIFVTVSVLLCLTNKVSCSILMQPTTYTWKITIVQFCSLTNGFKKLCIWLWLLTINKSTHSNLAYNTQQKKSVLVCRQSLSKISWEESVSFIIKQYCLLQWKYLYKLLKQTTKHISDITREKQTATTKRHKYIYYNYAH